MRRRGYVYFAEMAMPNGSVCLKIGFSMQPQERLRDLSTASPAPISLVHVVPADSALEKSLHHKFAKHRLHGEWFSDCVEIREEIRSLVPIARRRRQPPPPRNIVQISFSVPPHIHTALVEKSKNCGLPIAAVSRAIIEMHFDPKDKPHWFR